MDERKAETSDLNEAPNPALATKPGREPGAIDLFRDQCSYLHDRLDLLHHRLQPVLGPDYPSEVMETDVQAADILQLVSDVRRAAARVDGLIARLVV